MNEKRAMFAEVRETISQDPFSIQFVRPWLRSLLPGHSPLGDQLPWMNFWMIRWLRTHLRPSMKAFEYGSGGSTIFVARRVAALTSVEHDARWYELVSQALRREGIANCDLRLVPPEPHPQGRDVPYGPTSYSSVTPHAIGLSFERYVRTVEEFPDRSLDFVLVDGYARFSCASAAIPKIRKGGHLVVDDTDWPKYRPIVAALEAFPRRDFVGATPFQRNLRQTSVWRV